MSREPIRKKRRLSASSAAAQPSSSQVIAASEADVDGIADSSFARHAAKWDLEQGYEKRPRKQKQKENLRLPIKTADGQLKQVKTPIIEDVDDSSYFSDEEHDVTKAESTSHEQKQEQPRLSKSEEIMQAKEELARIAALLNEDPETHISSLKTLLEITASENPAVTKLGLVTQLSVYKDIIPGYRIRPLSENESKGQASKDVRKLRNFEQSIIANYQIYVKDLARNSALLKTSGATQDTSLGSVALSCAANMLGAAPHFNFRGDLLRILVDRLSMRAKGSDFSNAIEALQKLFTEDDEGNASLEAVSMLSKMIRAKDGVVHAEVLNVLLSLRLLSEFSHKGSTTRIDPTTQKAASQRDKLSKKQRVFRTKKERKLAKENRAIEKEMREADAVVSHEQRDKNQSETLKLVFGIYFRILKARVPSLMGPVLEGLVKYAHLINQDFFGDLLEALKELIQEYENIDPENGVETVEGQNYEQLEAVARNTTRESLLCCITAFALLEGQDAAASATNLHLDLSFFTTHLYRTLLALSLNPDLELSPKSLHLPDPHSAKTGNAVTEQRTKVDVQTTIVLLLRSLQSILIPSSNPHSTPPIRVAAFIQQILMTSLQVPEKSCTAMQRLVHQVVKTHKRKIVALWNTEERRGDGMFDPLTGTVEGSNPFASTVWEGELLRLHFAPDVRQGWIDVEKLVAE